MRQSTRHKLIWGWLRLFLSLARMVLAMASMILLLTLGHHPMTWGFVAATGVAAITSHVLYKAQPDSHSE